VEQVEVRTCEDKITKACGSFVYLGTLTSPSASATPEVRRRIGIALGTFGSLGKIWKSKSIARKTKSRLYVALILSILLYNAEVLPLKTQDMKALEGVHFRMLRCMMNLREDDTRISMQELLQAFGLPSLAQLISQKRLRWVGHALRRPEYDRSLISVSNTLMDEDSHWTNLVRDDCAKFKIPFDKLRALAQDSSRFRRISCWHTTSTEKK